MSGVQGWKPVEISSPISQWIALPWGELSLPLKQFYSKCPLRLGLLMIGHICGVQSGLNWPLCLSFCIDCYFGCGFCVLFPQHAGFLVLQWSGRIFTQRDYVSFAKFSMRPLALGRSLDILCKREWILNSRSLKYQPSSYRTIIVLVMVLHSFA